MPSARSGIGRGQVSFSRKCGRSDRPGCTRMKIARETAVPAGHALAVDMAGRYVKLFRNGRNQAVRIPREFELPGTDAIMRKEGQRLIIEPVPPKSLLAVLGSLPTLEEDFPAI